MKLVLFTLVFLFASASSASAQMIPGGGGIALTPAATVQMIPGIGNAAAIAIMSQVGLAKTEASLECQNAWMSRTTVIFSRASFPDHWDRFNTRILLNTLLTAQEVVDGLNICMSIDSLLDQADTLADAANTDAIDGLALWVKGDAELTNCQFAQSLASFTASIVKSKAATAGFGDANNDLLDAADLYFDLLQIQ